VRLVSHIQKSTTFKLLVGEVDDLLCEMLCVKNVKMTELTFCLKTSIALWQILKSRKFLFC